MLVLARDELVEAGIKKFPLLEKEKHTKEATLNLIDSVKRSLQVPPPTKSPNKEISAIFEENQRTRTASLFTIIGVDETLAFEIADEIIANPPKMS